MNQEQAGFEICKALCETVHEIVTGELKETIDKLAEVHTLAVTHGNGEDAGIKMLSGTLNALNECLTLMEEEASREYAPPASAPPAASQCGCGRSHEGAEPRRGVMRQVPGAHAALLRGMGMTEEQIAAVLKISN